MSEFQDRLSIARLFDQSGPVVHLRHADASGVPRAVLRRSEVRGLVRRVGKSAFVLEEAYQAGDPWERFRLRSIGFAMCCAPTTHLTGWAAAVLHGLPTFGAAPATPVAVRSGDAHTASNATPYGRVRTGHLPPRHRTVRAGVPTVGLAYTVVDVARHFGSTAGLMVADAVLSRGVHREILARLTEEMVRYPGMETARWVVEYADQRSESPLETLGRLAFLARGRAVPVSNVWFEVSGRAFRVDHYLPEVGVVMEADGAIKYNNRPDSDQIVKNEKDRERLLRKLGLGVVRYDWSLALSNPRELVRRVDEQARGLNGQFRVVPWSFEAPFAGMNFVVL